MKRNYKALVRAVNKHANLDASVFIVFLGFGTYFETLKNQFLGDDATQIVNNLPVHSIANIKLFFEGGTFYIGNGLAPLNGVYFRPLMLTFFSLLYTLFGPDPLYFHVFQLLLCIGSSIVLYLLFRYSFKAGAALLLAVIFLIHPLDSQVVYEIAALQDALYFFFGITAVYISIRFKSKRSLLLAVGCLVLSLLSKESGILFVALELLYLFWYSRKRLVTFVSLMVVPLILYLVLRVNAVGWLNSSRSAPIDSLSFTGRLMTAPSIPVFYLSKVIFPWRLASGYFWVYPHFSFLHFVIPLIIDVAIGAVAIYIAHLIRVKGSSALYRAYMFYLIWFGLGILLSLQIIPLDLTACDIWFYPAMAGLLGMLGIVATTFAGTFKHYRKIIYCVLAIIVILFCIRSIVRGRDWYDNTSLAYADVKASNDNYLAYGRLAGMYISQGKFRQAKIDMVRAVNIYPSDINYYDYGRILGYEKQYVAAKAAYTKGLTYGDATQIYEELGELTLVSGTQKANQRFLNGAVSKFPNDPTLWMYLALFDQQHGNTGGAQAAITQANTIGTLPPGLYTNIMGNLSFPLGMSDLGVNMLEIPSGPGGSRPVGSLDL